MSEVKEEDTLKTMETVQHRISENDPLMKQCRICFDDEITDIQNGLESKWLCPCHCDGTMKWVHERCLKEWLKQAPFPQQSACSACKFTYRKYWVVKSVNDWSFPKLNLNVWDVIEISLDLYSTIKLIRGFYQTLQGQRSLVAQICYFFFWKTFIFTDRRALFYRSLGTHMISSVCEPQVKDAKEDEEPTKMID
uniref:RING-CH-type domain-containing protein n=1 Tax=Panagrolaimus sp. JU765 TaxID=591449 RepID=A0AC34QYX3_9BILA